MMGHDSCVISCKRDAKTGEYLLVNVNGETAGRAIVDVTGHEGMIVVLNSRHEVVLVLKKPASRAMNVTILVPRRGVGQETKGLAVHGSLKKKILAYETIHEFRSAIGSESMRACPAGFPRHIAIIKAGAAIATIEFEQSGILTRVREPVADPDLLTIICIMLAVCIPFPAPRTGPCSNACQTLESWCIRGKK